MFQPSYLDSEAPQPSRAWPEYHSLETMDARFRVFSDRARLVLGLTPATLQWYHDGYANFVRFLRETGRLDASIAVTPDLLEAWQAWNRNRNIAAHTLKTYWTSLKRFIRSVAERDALANPFQYAPSPKLPIHTYKALTPSECVRVIATVLNYRWATKYEGARNAAVIGIALYAGLRKREILRLEWRDVDLEEGTIFIRRGKGPHGGKDRKAYIGSELRELLVAYTRERNARNLHTPEYFVSSRSNRGVTDMMVRKVVENVSRASGIHFSLHVLRHSFVTMLLRSGVPIHIARDLAGHSNIQTTEGYSRVFSEDLKKHIEAVRFRTS